MVIIACSGKFHAFSLAEQLNRHQLLHSFYTPYAYQKNANWRKLAKRVDKEEIPVDKIKTLIPWAIGSKLWDWPWFWNELFDHWVAHQLKHRDDYDVFVGWSGMCLKSLQVAKAKGKKTIVTRGSAHIVAQNELLQSEYSKRGINYSIDRRTIKKELAEYEMADYITVLSQFAQNTFEEKGFNPQKVVLNPLGVNLELFQPSSSNAIKSNIRLVYLGHLSFRKGIPYLLEAVEHLNQEYSFELLFVGGHTPEIEQWLKHHPLPNNCKQLGHIPYHELPELLKTCDIGIIPSIEDGFAQVIPQLLSSGVPVITTTNTGGPDMIQDGYNGYIIPIQSTEAIRDQLALLMEDTDLLAQLKLNAPVSMSNGFTWNDYGDRYNAFIRDILAVNS